jgi:hypothetical protein
VRRFETMPETTKLPRTELRRHRTRDLLWASILALVLTAAAAIMVGLGVFRYSRFEEAVLPGAVPGLFLTLLVPYAIYEKVWPIESIVFWIFTVVFSFFWYFSIFYVGIKLVRFVINAIRS